MSFSRALFAVVCTVVASTAVAQVTSCPASVVDGRGRHVLNNVSLYDGPPAQMASLAPDTSGNEDRWSTDGVDPYLVCQYKGTAKTVTLHAKAASLCVARSKPFTAYCK